MGARLLSLLRLSRPTHPPLIIITLGLSMSLSESETSQLNDDVDVSGEGPSPPGGSGVEHTADVTGRKRPRKTARRQVRPHIATFSTVRAHSPAPTPPNAEQLVVRAASAPAAVRPHSSTLPDTLGFSAVLRCVSFATSQVRPCEPERSSVLRMRPQRRAVSSWPSLRRPSVLRGDLADHAACEIIRCTTEYINTKPKAVRSGKLIQQAKCEPCPAHSRISLTVRTRILYGDVVPSADFQTKEPVLARVDTERELPRVAELHPS